MTAVTLQQTMAVPDIIDQTRYLLKFGTIPGSSRQSQNLSLKCFSVVIPGFSNEAFEAHMHGHVRSFRGRKMYERQMSVSAYEDSEADTLSVLRQWHEFVVGTESGNSGGYIKDYAILAELSVFDTTGRENIRDQFVNLFPLQIQDTQLGSESSNAVQVQAMFKFDYMESITHSSL